MNKIDYSKPFVWVSAQTNGGGSRDIREMHTPHLYNTFIMIWNHSVPKKFQVGENFRQYRFGAFYTREYVLEAFLRMYHELKKRPLMPWMKSGISRVEDIVLGSASGNQTLPDFSSDYSTSFLTKHFHVEDDTEFDDNSSDDRY